MGFAVVIKKRQDPGTHLSNPVWRNSRNRMGRSRFCRKGDLAAVNAGEVEERVAVAAREHPAPERRHRDPDQVSQDPRRPSATITALDRLHSDQHKSWKTTIDRIREMLEE
jgi:hypothetical protein